MAYRYSLNDLVLCLVGTVITLYTQQGCKVDQWFYQSKGEAKEVYFAVVDDWDLLQG